MAQAALPNPFPLPGKLPLATTFPELVGLTFFGPPSPLNRHQFSSHFNTGLIIGGAIGGIAAFILMGAAVYHFSVRKYEQQRELLLEQLRRQQHEEHHPEHLSLDRDATAPSLTSHELKPQQGGVGEDSAVNLEPFLDQVYPRYYVDADGRVASIVVNVVPAHITTSSLQKQSDARASIIIHADDNEENGDTNAHRTCAPLRQRESTPLS